MSVAYMKIRCHNPTCRAFLTKPGELNYLAFLDHHGWEVQAIDDEPGPYCERCKQ